MDTQQTTTPGGHAQRPGRRHAREVPLALAVALLAGCPDFQSLSRCWYDGACPVDMAGDGGAGDMVTIDARAVDAATDSGAREDRFLEDGAEVLPDLPPEPDMTMGADLIMVPDLVAVPDLTVAPDLAYTGPPSCRDLPQTCGVARDANCCTSLPVTGNLLFYRSFDMALDGMYANKNYPAKVSDFRLDRYEVTVGRFRAFVTTGRGTQDKPPLAGDGAHPRVMGSGWSMDWRGNLLTDSAALKTALKCNGQGTWTDAPGNGENLPINCASWYEAFAFCTWDGGRLPTEAEWNYAAAGGTEQRAYPWSNPPGSTTIDASYAVYGGAAIAAVGTKSTKGDGRWGHADLSGNVWEWVLDWYVDPYVIPCNDCAVITGGNERSLRGGNFSGSAAVLRAASRPHAAPTLRDNSSGIRCARSAPPPSLLPHLRSPIRTAVGKGPHSLAGTDFNADGKLDVAAVLGPDRTVAILLGNGNGGFKPGASYPQAAVPNLAAKGDLNSDGRADVVVATQAGVTVLLGRGDGTFTENATASGAAPNDVVVGDVTGDGKTDVISANYQAGSVGVFAGRGDGSLGMPTFIPVGMAARAIAAGDVNKDGRADVVVAQEFSNRVSVLLGTGNGLGAPANLAVGMQPTALAVADLDGDGDLDVVTTHYNSADVRALWNKGDGTFPPADERLETVGAGPLSVAVLDVDGDGKLDLAVAAEKGNAIDLLQNRGGGMFVAAGQVPVGAGPRCVIAEDVNGDGKRDIIVASTASNEVFVILRR